MVIKREIVQKHPWVVLNLLKAFERANEVADEIRMKELEYHIATGKVPRELVPELKVPMARHGIKSNRTVLETAAAYSHEQALTPRLMKLDEIFAPSTMEQ
jgi:4,5-dihydroxyphthalate decarboxylase